MNHRAPKVIKVTFLHPVEAKALRKGWDEAYGRNCKDTCEKTKTNLKMFTDLMIDVKSKQSMTLQFDEEGVNIAFDGKDPHSGHITSQAFRKNVLAIFIGDKPAQQELKAGLLGKH